MGPHWKSGAWVLAEEPERSGYSQGELGEIHMKQDKRKRVRYDVKYPVMMLTSHGVLTGETRNLSQHGAFIHCPRRLQVNERLFLIIELPFDPPLELPAHVVWCRTRDSGDDRAPQGVAVRFTW